MKVGFPRALYYFDYFPFWAGFFHQLNIDVVTSPPTQRRIMELGLKNASDETCLPLKLMAGHIQALSGVDWIFLPRMVSLEAETYTCPKFLGIPESLLSAVPTGIPVLTVTMNWRKGQRDVLRELQKMGEQLGKSKEEIQKAFCEGQTWQNRFQETKGSVGDFSEVKPRTVPKADCLRIALVGHSYLTQESYANLNLLRKLREKAEVQLIQNVDQDDINYNLSGLRKKLFWNHSKTIYGAGNKFVDDPNIDGIIYLTCFGCGTDSIVQELLSRKARQQHKPYMVITLDEHSGEAGLITRLEAFLDMVERRRVHEGYVSTYGERLDYHSNTL